MGQILFQTLVGAIAGLLAWLVAEPMFPKNYSSAEWGRVELIFILLLGALVGLAIGSVRGLRQGGKIHLLRNAGVGLILGAIGATFGYQVGGILHQSLFPGVDFSGNEPFFARMPARVVALMPVGAFLGLAIGAGGWTLRRLTVGLIGGVLGGLIAGALFDPIAMAVSPAQLALSGGFESTSNGVPVIVAETGGVSRAIFSVLIGGFVGLFIGIVERMVRTAWVRLVLGRNEGREWVVDAPQTFLGRSESAHVPLFGDPHVAPMHACIARQGDAYLLMDGGSPLGTGLNGQRVTQAPLFDGAQIQIGAHTLLFQMKHGSAPQRAAEAMRAQAYLPGGVPAQAVPATQAAGGYASMQAPVSMPTQAVPAPAATPAWSLVATNGPLAGQRFAVGGVLEAGREATGISLGFDSSASRRHASFAPTSGGLQVTDLGSTNGTYVNDQKTPTASLRPGDLVRIGATVFRVEG
jgi:pSer/pThr/pTyr-binding forkhead associated (FHA) protein